MCYKTKDQKFLARNSKFLTRENRLNIVNNDAKSQYWCKLFNESFNTCLVALLENKDGYTFRVRIRMTEIITPIKNEVITATTNENLAVLGWDAPNSFDTLTLQKIYSGFNFSDILRSSTEIYIALLRCVSLSLTL